MLDFYRQVGAQTDLCLIDDQSSTAMSVLPVFKTGGRGCFFNLASNNSFTKEELLSQIGKITSKVDAFLFGYPHLMPQLQGENLKTMLNSVRGKLGSEILIGVDLNGVSADNHNEQLLGPALGEVDILHLNEEEAEILSGCNKKDLLGADDKLQMVCDQLHQGGCAVVMLSMGSKGTFLSVTKDMDRLAKSPFSKNWKGSVRVPAFAVQGADVNANGAGDALFSGFCWVAATQDDLSLEQAGAFASLVARQRCDPRTRDSPSQTAMDLVCLVKKKEFPPPIA